MLAKKDHCPSSGEHTPLKERAGDEPDEACQPPSTQSPSTEVEAKKDHCPSSGEHTPLKERAGDEPDEACQPPSTQLPSTEVEVLTDEESLLSSFSESDADDKPPAPQASPASNEDEVLMTSFTDGQEPYSTSTSSSVVKPKRIATIKQDAGDDEDSGVSEHDEKDKKRRVERPKKTVNKGKLQQDNDDWDGEDRQAAAARSPEKDGEKTAVTREGSDVVVKKQDK